MIDKIKERKAEIESMSVDLPKGIGDMIDFRMIYRVKGQQKLFSPKIDQNKSGMIPMYEYLNENNKIVVPFKDLVCIGKKSFLTNELERKTNPCGEKKAPVTFKSLHISEIFNILNEHFIDEDACFLDNVKELNSLEIRDHEKDMICKWYNEIKNKIITIERLEALKNQENVKIH